MFTCSHSHVFTCSHSHVFTFTSLYFVVFCSTVCMCLVVYLRLLSIYISVVCASGLTVDTCLFEFASVYLCVL